MMDSSIKNIGDLKAEISRLQIIKELQGAKLKVRFNTPSALFRTVLSLYPKSHDGALKSGIFFNQDFVRLLSRILLPATLNGTVFRKSNFVVKALVGFVSQKASRYISEDSVSGLLGKLKSMFAKKDKKDDYGIPPLSETY
jgi:hypothetical protein